MASEAASLKIPVKNLATVLKKANPESTELISTE
jgi:hypothetical protein